MFNYILKHIDLKNVLISYFDNGTKNICRLVSTDFKNIIPINKDMVHYAIKVESMSLLRYVNPLKIYHRIDLLKAITSTPKIFQYIIKKLNIIITDYKYTFKRINDKIKKNKNKENIENNLKWLINTNSYKNLRLYLAYYGHLSILKWIQSTNYLKLDIYLSNNAIKGGHLQVVKWLSYIHCPFDRACYNATKYEKLNILIWLVKNRYHINWDICYNIGNDKIKEWIQNNRNISYKK